MMLQRFALKNGAPQLGELLRRQYDLRVVEQVQGSRLRILMGKTPALLPPHLRALQTHRYEDLLDSPLINEKLSHVHTHSTSDH